MSEGGVAWARDDIPDEVLSGAYRGNLLPHNPRPAPHIQALAIACALLCALNGGIGWAGGS